MFSRFGPVLSVQMLLRGTSTSSGIGTVEMERLEDAQKAVSALHRSYLDGLLVLVFLASFGTQS
jgi:RNA recognition motif-containing protein